MEDTVFDTVIAVAYIYPILIRSGAAANRRTVLKLDLASSYAFRHTRQMESLTKVLQGGVCYSVFNKI